uniref:Uncharacterized protein n=1 Tax=Glossina pallidipes TaxID=7398 RepID=A0A1B0ADS0_GLOPL
MNVIEAKRKDLTSCLVFPAIDEHNSLDIIRDSITITTTPTVITATSFALKAETNTAVVKAIATVSATATATAASASAAVAFYPFLHPLESTLIEIYHGKDSKCNANDSIQFSQQVY